MAQQDFIFELTIPTATSITLPFVDFALFDCTVSWGDGTTSTITAYDDADRIHAYDAGTFQVSINGYCGGWQVDSGAIKDYLTDIIQFGTQTMFTVRAFRGCGLLNDVTATDLPGFRRGQEEYFFSSCPINLDLTNAYMGDGRLWRGFWGGGNLGDPRGWDISRGEYFQGWLGGAEWNYDITPWKDSIAVGVTDRTVKTWDSFFAGNSIFNCGDAAGVFGSNLKWFRTYGANLSSMFSGCSVFNQDISTNVQNAGQPDEYVAWDISQVTELRFMFSGCSVFNQDLSSWDTSSVTTMTSMFNNAKAFDQDLGSWDTSSVTSMNGMFANSVFKNGGVGGVGVGLDAWDVSSVTDFYGMFLRQYNDGFNQYIGSWVLKPSASISCLTMFQENYNFNQNIGGWQNTNSIVNMGSMFRGATAFNNGGVGGVGVGLDAWDTSRVTNMVRLFENAWAFNQYIGSWDTANVSNFSVCFTSASVFNQDISGWVTAKATNMAQMFENADSFNNGDAAGVSGGGVGIGMDTWDVTSVVTMLRMFYNNAAFNQYIGSWDTASVLSFEAMFQSATSYNQSCAGWKIHSATTCELMFFDSAMSAANLEATMYAWSLDPLTATGVNATNIIRSATYAVGSNMDLALNDPTNGLVAAKGWAVTGITIV